MVETIENRLVRAAVVAHRLGVTESRVYELTRLGLLPAVRLGRQLRYQPQEIEAFIEGGGRPLESKE